jgi:hypothetical protein
MINFDALVDRYLAAWNESDADRRRKAIAALWSEDGGYTDPLASVTGWPGLEAVLTGAHNQFKGFVFKRLGRVDGHHNTARFQWELVPTAGGESIVIGSDVAVVGEDGRLRHVYGFLDKVPAG